jgi:hypothetical protein
VLDTTLIGMIHPSAVEEGRGQGVVVHARLDRPLAVGGRTVLSIPTIVALKARIVGPGTRPNTVQIGFSTYWAERNGSEGGYELKSDELVFTVARRGPAPPGLNLFVPLDTKLRFTIGSSASSAAPAAGAATATPPARPAPAPPSAAAPPPASGPQDRQQQAEERRKQAERQAACVQQAMRDHPPGSAGNTQALIACTKAK